MIENLTDAQRKQLELAEKLFRTAGRSKGEADQYVAKAMAILESLNLDMSVLEEGGTETVKRSDTKFTGGRYKYQRDIWSYVADLHFCHYWTQYSWDKEKISPYAIKTKGAAYAKANRGGYRNEHRIVGRTVNVIATKNMATYIEDTIERLLRDHMEAENRKDLHNSVYCISFRRGVAEAIVDKVFQRRQHMLAEEQRKAKEAAERAAAAGKAGDTGKALTLGTLAQQERQANYDFLNGDGAWAKREAKRAEWAKQAREAEEAHTKWAAENPEEARKQEEERLKEDRKRSNRRYRPKANKTNTDWSAYSAGEAAGRTVSIDPQAGGRAAPAGLL